jgi:hypothetical protein
MDIIHITTDEREKDEGNIDIAGSGGRLVPASGLYSAETGYLHMNA